MPMTIPEIRDELTTLFALPYCPREIAERGEALIKEMYRRKAERVAPRTSHRVTAVMRNKIRVFAKLNPRMSQQKIGEHFGVGAGRVSEALKGKRK